LRTPEFIEEDTFMVTMWRKDEEKSDTEKVIENQNMEKIIILYSKQCFYYAK
jgi:hypothetical protein